MMRVIGTFLLVTCLGLPHVLLAYAVIPHEVSRPYDVVSLTNFTNEQFIIGELTNDPDMVEVVSDKDFILRAEIRALPGETLPLLTGIVVKVLEPRGVAEVARLKPSEASWEERRDSVSRLPYLAGPSFATTTGPGTYRIEVSTAENSGKYILVVGSEQINSGYSATWQAVANLYEFYEVSKFGMIRTPLVYYPVGIALLFLGFGYTVYRTRHRIPFLNHA